MGDKRYEGFQVAVPQSLRVSFDGVSAADDLTNDLDRVFATVADRRLAVVCVGTDRSTGDAFGPIVGARLKHAVRWPWVDIYGTLDEPVHAVNLASTLQEVYSAQPEKPFIVAVDACLGKFDHVGQIIMEPGPLRPGAGVQKSLPEFGDYTLTGVVNVSGFMEYFVLQNTRLGIVMRMSDVVVSALLASLHKLALRRSLIGRGSMQQTAAATEGLDPPANAPNAPQPAG